MFNLLFCSLDETEVDLDTDHYYEKKLVQNITTEGGLTKIPTKETLKDFVKK